MIRFFLKTILFLSIINGLNASDFIQAQQVYTAETKMFMLQWKQYNQKGAYAPTLESIQETFGLRELSSSQGKGADLVLPVFVSFSSEEALSQVLPLAEALGFKVQTRLKTICTGFVPVNELEALGRIKGIIQIQTVRKVRPVMDKSRKYCKVDSVQMGILTTIKGEKVSYDGKGVIVGIIDDGFDYTHPNFYDPDQTSTYRVKRVWDQRNNQGESPIGYSYGTEYTTPGAILAAQSSSDKESHASHVSGIAAGSGAGTAYKGMAPKSDLVFVPCNFQDQGILDGVKYIKDYASQQKQACVINLSLGGHTGPHDGTSAFDRALDEFKSPGFVVVGSAGNEGLNELYISHTFTPNTADTMFYTVIKYFDLRNQDDYVDLWSDNNSAIEVAVVVLKDGAIKAQSTFVSSDQGEASEQTLKVSGSTVCRVSFLPETNVYNQKQRMLLGVDASSQNGRSTYKYMLKIKSKNTKETASLQMWSNSNTLTSNGYIDATNPVKSGNNSHTVGEIGGTSKSILTVGAYVSRVAGKSLKDSRIKENDLAPFSSQGPTADGRIKPDITAPGSTIISSFNSYDASVDPMEMVQSVIHNNRTYYFGGMQGTSMSSPAVAGIVALWLQAHPNWQIDSIKKYMNQTAINDIYTGQVRNNPTNLWGRGKIDAYNLLKLAPGDSLVVGPEVEIHTLSELIKQPADDTTLYKYTGIATITMAQTERQQKWIQDATAAIMIDDSAGKVKASYAIGNGITQLKGTLSSSSGFLTITPTEDAQKVEKADKIQVQDISLAALKEADSAPALQSRLVCLNHVLMPDPGSFEKAKGYRLKQGEILGNLLYTFFPESDYLGEKCPDTSMKLTGLIVFKDGAYYIAPRNKTDIVPDQRSRANEDEFYAGKLTIYPNPNRGHFTVVSPLKGTAAEIEMIDLKGGRCIYRNYSQAETLDIEVKAKGIYLLRWKAANKVYTAKVNLQ